MSRHNRERRQFRAKAKRNLAHCGETLLTGYEVARCKKHGKRKLAGRAA